MVGVELAEGRDAAVRASTSAATSRSCLGHEDHGISKAGLAACDEVAFLPQFGRIGSLNVATAASIAMYEWARQQLSEDQSRFRSEAGSDSDRA